jgi:hypothetical protein
MTANDTTPSEGQEGTDQQIKTLDVAGDFAAEQVHGTATLEVRRLPSKPDREVSVAVRYPNGTVAAVDLTPAEAREFGRALFYVAELEGSD